MCLEFDLKKNWREGYVSNGQVAFKFVTGHRLSTGLSGMLNLVKQVPSLVFQL